MIFPFWSIAIENIHVTRVSKFIRLKADVEVGLGVNVDVGFAVGVDVGFGDEVGV
jgi:hypothetical protein